MKKFAKNRPFSVLIPDGETNNSLSVVRCLGEEKNVKIFVLSKGKNNPVRYSRYISKFIHYSNGETKEEKLAAIIDAIEKTNADILLPLDIDIIRLVSEYKEILSKLIAIAPVPDVNSFDIANDKWLLSLWLKENNISHPKTTLFNSSNNIDEVISSIVFPIIVKPTNGFAGRGIKICENAEELQSWHQEFDHSEDFIFQSYIKGYDIDCSVICLEGRILVHTIQKSIKYSKDDPWAYAMQFLQNDEVFNIVKEVAEKFNWSGVNNIALRYDEEMCQMKVIEINPRFWASVLASIFAGVNFPHFSCLSGLKRELPEIETQNTIVIRTGDALKMILKRFKNQSYLLFDNTYFEYTVKDPLPTIMKENIKYYNHYKKRWASFIVYMNRYWSPRTGNIIQKAARG